ncbi:helix-turn-helix transcriptional regulator [Alicyclobacillus dauci]|uniref:Helix-turn-helix domain-containing protein n=1 Tax=Alicyclobacillus dauci TaxID=1475485 RepID=A0ABY6YYB2_9BACL|nr:helix-turn-helix domain-containing protein [Alicyclobacillus dauci]WAH35069.1 helix-turn-helix domain-containing protein [Alicyclobacillus dauci]
MIRSNLREVIEQRGIKQTWLAERSGVTTTTLSQIVTGKRVPTLEVAFRIAKVLDLRIDEVWYHEDDE